MGVYEFFQLYFGQSKVNSDLASKAILTNKRCKTVYGPVRTKSSPWRVINIQTSWTVIHFDTAMFSYISTLSFLFYVLAAGDSNLPDILQEAQIRVLELSDCQERYSSTPYQVYNESICVFKLNDTDAHTGSCYVCIYMTRCWTHFRFHQFPGKSL